MPTFHESLTAWKQSEEIVLAWIKKKYPSAILINGYCKQMDLFIPEKNESCEIKQDRKSDHTGNFVIEVSFWWKPSWITTTKANWWVFLDSTYMHWITPESIKDCILYHWIRLVEFTWPGDSCSKRVYLVPKETLSKYVSFIIPYS